MRSRAEYHKRCFLEHEVTKASLLLPTYLMQEVWTNDDGTYDPGVSMKVLLDQSEDFHPLYLYYIQYIFIYSLKIWTTIIKNSTRRLFEFNKIPA